MVHAVNTFLFTIFTKSHNAMHLYSFALHKCMVTVVVQNRVLFHYFDFPAHSIMEFSKNSEY